MGIVEGGFMITHMHIGFRVDDYDHWKTDYDASIDQRRAVGAI